jgi:hypothetical protein
LGHTTPSEAASGGQGVDEPVGWKELLMKNKTEGNMPQTEQPRFPIEGVDTTPANGIPRCTEHDLIPTYSRTRVGGWGDEQTFTVVGPGNKVTEGKNY